MSLAKSSWPVLLAVLIPLLSFGQQRPLLTEDPRIIAPGTVTTEFGVEVLTRARFPLSKLVGTELSPVSGLHFSLGERAEFQLTGPLHHFLWVHENGTGRRNDWGDGAVSTKIRIVGEKGKLPIVGFRTSVVLPNSNDQRGIGTNTTKFFADLLFGKHFGDVFVFGSGGLGILGDTLNPRAQQDVMTYGIAALLPLTPHAELAGEIHGLSNPREDPSPGGEDRAEIRAGARFRLGKTRWDVAATVGLTRLDHKGGVVFGMTRDFRLWK